MYEGHMPNGSPVQKHSAGELYPVVIVAYGDGTWRWVDPEKQAAGVIRWDTQAGCKRSARLWMTLRDTYKPSKGYRLAYREFSQ